MALVEHPMSRRVRFHAGQRCFMYENARCKGMAERLRRTFWPVYTGTRGCGRRDGQQQGRAFDAELTAHVNRGAPATARVALFMRTLRARGWEPVRSQVPLLTSRRPFVATAIDLLCRDTANGACVIVEAKHTTMTPQQHAATYKRACPRRPRMPNGLVNSEYNHHQMQLGCMVRAVRRLGFRATGAVVLVLGEHARVRVFTQAPVMHKASTYTTPRRRR